MKQLVCEMCGSSDLFKQDGIFTCQVCGCKYSLEEAKKLFIEVEGVLNVQGKFQIDHSHEINSRIQNALAEYKMKNYKRASTMFSEILNMDHENATAIIYKAAAEGWDYESFPDNRIADVAKEMKRAISVLRAQHEEDDAFTDAVVPIIREFDLISRGLYFEGNRFMDEVLKESERLGYEQAIEKGLAERSSSPAVAFAHRRKALEYEKEMEVFAQKVTDLVSINMSKVYGAMTEVFDAVMEALGESTNVSYGFIVHMETYVAAYYDWVAFRNYASVNDKHFAGMREKFEAFKKRIADKEKEAKEERIRAYWEANNEKKQELEAEQSLLHAKKEEYENKIAQIDKEIEKINKEKTKPCPADEEREKCKEQRSCIVKEMGALGIFKGKEKKRLKEQYDQLCQRISELEAERVEQKRAKEKEVNEKIAPLEAEKKNAYAEMNNVKARLDEIIQEFSKDRT